VRHRASVARVGEKLRTAEARGAVAGPAISSEGVEPVPDGGARYRFKPGWRNGSVVVDFDLNDIVADWPLWSCDRTRGW